MSNNIIETYENIPVVSHKIVAENTANQEVSIRNIINKYIDDFKVFGKLHFKNEPITNTKNRVNNLVTYYLNEQQATLLLTYLKNTSIVRKFKIELVKAFYNLKQELKDKSNPKLEKDEIINLIEKGLKYDELLEKYIISDTQKGLFIVYAKEFIGVANSINTQMSKWENLKEKLENILNNGIERCKQTGFKPIKGEQLTIRI